MYTTHQTCRACGLGKLTIPTLKQSCAAGPSQEEDSLVPVFDLGLQPLANDFVGPGEEQAGYAPLKVMFCPRCTLAQLSVVVRPDIMYKQYSYVTSPSDTMKQHFQRLAEDIKSETTGRTVLEIGSNDGALLSEFGRMGFGPLLGVDPAENLAKIANERGIQTVCNFFSHDVARNVAETHFKPDIILARHVFCHVPDWHNFVSGLQALTHPGTLICIEVPYVGDLLDRTAFDTIYHEHLSMLSVRSVQALLKNSGLRLSRIIRYPIHGGAILLMLKPCCSMSSEHPSVNEFLEEEARTMTAARWRAFSVNASDQISNLKTYVRDLVLNGKRVAGLGASAKSTVWINACRFGRKELSFIADYTMQKQYKRSPGTEIPIVDEGAILRELPDYVIVFCWNFLDEVIRNNQLALSKGVKFIVPVPKVEVISA